MHDALKRLAALVVGLVVLSACAPPPRPFEHDSSMTTNRRLTRDKVELAIGAPRNMPTEMGQRVAAALAMELQAYGIIATVQPADAPIQVSGTMSTRDAGETGIEVQIDWRIEGAPKTAEPQTSRTRARPEDYGEASERLVSRIAQQSAPRVATLIGKPPTYQARSLGQVAAGMSVPVETPLDPVAATAMAAASSGAPPPTSTQPGQPQEAHVKVMVAPVTGATITLTCASCGCAGLADEGGGVPDEAAAIAVAVTGSTGVSIGTLMPAATWPGERAMKVGGLPIRVATRGAACWAMRETSRSLASP